MLGLFVILSLSLYLCVSLSLSSRGCQCIVHVISFQKMYGLDGLKHHKVEKSLDITIVTTDNGRSLKIELEFCEVEFAIETKLFPLHYRARPIKEGQFRFAKLASHFIRIQIFQVYL